MGMNMGMGDAFNLAWKLGAGGARSRCRSLLLDSYNAKRHPVGAEVIAQAGRMIKPALVSNPVLQEVRNHLLGMVLGFSAVREASNSFVPTVTS